MAELLVKRVASSVFVLIAAIVIVFVLMHVVGDPAAASLGPHARAEQLRAFREQHGLDRPVLEQLGSYLGDVARGNLGKSYRTDEPVTDVILARLPRTALLGGMAMGFEVIIGVLFGVLAAVRRNTWIDTGVMATSFVGISAPTFLSGILFLYFFAFRLGWFPVGGWGTSPTDHVYHALLPAFTLAIIGAATYARVMRSEMLETLQADYVRTARAKGLGPLRVIFAHGARNALLPIVTIMGMQLATLVSGAIITETIYGWPGVGRLAIESIHTMDAPIIMGVVVMVSATVQVGNLLADLAVAGLDPRIRIESAK